MKTPLEWAKDPDATLEQLERVLDKHPKEVLENPVLDLYILADPEMGLQIWRGAWWVWLRKQYQDMREKAKWRDVKPFEVWTNEFWKARRPELYAFGELPPFYIPQHEIPSAAIKCLMDRSQDLIGREGNVTLLQYLAEATAALARIQGRALDWPKSKMKPNRRRRR